MIYANISELLTHGYKLEEGVEFHFRQLFLAEFGPLYWFYLLGGLVLPIAIVLVPATRTVWGMVVAAVFVTISMWIERYVIVVTGLRVPLMPYEPASYLPTWVEWSMLAGGLAVFALLITIFSKFFPIIAVWEVAEEHDSAAVMAESVQMAAPEHSS
jgi:molybdopterin-containing oxidoreductase family membrane subunit